MIRWMCMSIKNPIASSWNLSTFWSISILVKITQLSSKENVLTGMFRHVQTMEVSNFLIHFSWGNCFVGRDWINCWFLMAADSYWKLYWMAFIQPEKEKKRLRHANNSIFLTGKSANYYTFFTTVIWLVFPPFDTLIYALNPRKKQNTFS